MKEITKLANQMRMVKKNLSQAYRENRLDDARLLERDRVQLAWMIASYQPKSEGMPAWMIGR